MHPTPSTMIIWFNRGFYFQFCVIKILTKNFQKFRKLGQIYTREKFPKIPKFSNLSKSEKEKLFGKPLD
jgi:hypothetical protein